MKCSTKEADKTAGEISEAQVVAHLKRHSDFFRRHMELLSQLDVPHDVDGVTSLIESQVKVLRGENKRFRRERGELLEAVRANEVLARRLHGALRSLLAADSPGRFFEAVAQQLPGHFSVQAVKLVLFGAAPKGRSGQLPWSQFEGSDSREHTRYGHLLRHGKSQALLLDRDKAILYFGKESEGLHSAVSLPLQGRSWQGLLLVGSDSSERFSGEVRFEMIDAFAQLLATVLERWIGTPA